MRAKNRTDNNKNIDLDQTTWEGSRKSQLRQWLKLTLRERLQAVENMGEITQHFQQMREQGRFKNTQKNDSQARISFYFIHEL